MKIYINIKIRFINKYIANNGFFLEKAPRFPLKLCKNEKGSNTSNTPSHICMAKIKMEINLPGNE